MRRILTRVIGIFLLATVMTAFSLLTFSDGDGVYRGEGLLTVHYLDVGQSDCTFIEVDGKYTVMIDAADEAHPDDVCRYVDDLGYDGIDALVLTHPHSDHIGGAERVLAEYEVDTVFMTDGEASGEDAQYLDRVDGIVEELEIERVCARKGTEFELGRLDGIFLAPTDVSFNDENEMSAVLSLHYGAQSFLFMGDAGAEAESVLLSSGADLSATVVKAGHHGSRGSSSQDFVTATGADYAVFSCGEGNDYGHPSPYTVDRWETSGARTFRTDKDSTVVALTDGNTVAVMPLSELDGSGTVLPDAASGGETESVERVHKYKLNTASHILHYVGCAILDGHTAINIEPSSEDIARLRAEGYKTCFYCFEQE